MEGGFRVFLFLSHSLSLLGPLEPGYMHGSGGYFVGKIFIPKHLLAPKADAVKSPCKLSVSLFLSATNPIKLREHESTVCVLPYWLV